MSALHNAHKAGQTGQWVDTWTQNHRFLFGNNCTCSTCFEALTPALFCLFPRPPAVNLCWSNFISVSTRDHSPPSRSLFLSFSSSVSLVLSLPLPIRTFRSITFPVYQHPPPFISVSASLVFPPSPSLRFSRHGDSCRKWTLPPCLSSC